MSLPSKEQITGNVTEAQFKNGMNNIIDFLKDLEIQSFIVDSWDKLSSLKPKIGDLAKTLDDSKVWSWDGEKWKDTFQSDLDLAKDYTLNQINQIISRIGDPLNLYEFEDSQGLAVVIIKPDGDIINPSYSLNTVGATTEEISKNVGQKFNALDEQNEAEPLYVFRDQLGNTVISFESSGDIIGPFGSFAKAIDSQKPAPIEETKEIQTREYMSDRFANVYAKTAEFFDDGSIKPFMGSYEQDYDFNAEDLVALKIQQPSAPLVIESPHFSDATIATPYSQTVHPYLCKFNSKVHDYNYIMISNPFHWSNDQLENPCIYGTNNLQEFKLLKEFEQPLAWSRNIENENYNSDSFAVFDHTTKCFYCFYRNSVIRLDKYEIQENNIYFRKTRDFINWTETQIVTNANNEALTGSLFSPSIMYSPAKRCWVMFHVENVFGYRTSNSLEGGWSEFIPIGTPPRIVAWHQETKYVGKNLVTLINDVAYNNGQGALWLGVSKDDGLTWTFSENPIFDGTYTDPYKGTFCAQIDGEEMSLNIVWSTNGNNPRDGWKLFSAKTNSMRIF